MDSLEKPTLIFMGNATMSPTSKMDFGKSQGVVTAWTAFFP